MYLAVILLSIFERAKDIISISRPDNSMKECEINSSYTEFQLQYIFKDKEPLFRRRKYLHFPKQLLLLYLNL